MLPAATFNKTLDGVAQQHHQALLLQSPSRRRPGTAKSSPTRSRPKSSGVRAPDRSKSRHNSPDREVAAQFANLNRAEEAAAARTAANSQPGPAAGSAGAAAGTDQFIAAVAAGAAQATDAPAAAAAAPAVGPRPQGGVVAADQAGRQETAGAEAEAGRVAADQAGTPQSAGSGRQAGAAGPDQAGRAPSAHLEQQAATAAATCQPGGAQSAGGGHQGTLAAPPSSPAPGAMSPAAGTPQQVLHRGSSSLKFPDGAGTAADQPALLRSPQLRRGLSFKQRTGSTASQVIHLRKVCRFALACMVQPELGTVMGQDSGVSVSLVGESCVQRVLTCCVQPA